MIGVNELIKIEPVRPQHALQILMVQSPPVVGMWDKWPQSHQRAGILSLLEGQKLFFLSPTRHKQSSSQAQLPLAAIL